MCDLEDTRELRDLVQRLPRGEYEFDAEAAALETRIKDLTGHPWVGEVIVYPPDPHPLEDELVRRLLACRPIALQLSTCAQVRGGGPGKVARGMELMGWSSYAG